MMKHCKNLIIAICAAMLVGCNSSKQQGQSGATTTDTRSLNEHYEALVSTYSDWENVSIPLKLELKEPKRISISGRAVMVRNKEIMISLRFFGMEVASLYLTNDSVFLTNKMQKYYAAENINALRGDFPVSIGDVQDLLLGQAFVLERGTLEKSTKKHVKLNQMGEYWSIMPKKFPQGAEYAFAISGDDKLQAFSVSHNDMAPLLCKYSNHAQTTAGTIAKSAEISLSASEIKLDALIRWESDKAKWNTENVRQWKKPKGYQRVSGEALFKALSEM